MSKFIAGIVAATAVGIGMIGVNGTITVPAAGSPSCMTKDEARKAFPGDHIYWHGPQRCWDNNGGRRRQKPAAANANPNESATSTAAGDTPGEAVVDEASAQAADRPSEPVIVPPVQFITDELSRGLSWPVLDRPVRARQDDSVIASSRPAGDDDDVVIGAPAAAAGSPDYMLENCCWPPPQAGTAEPASLRRMIIASTGACGLATALWLFVYRRRQLARLLWS